MNGRWHARASARSCAHELANGGWRGQLWCRKREGTGPSHGGMGCATDAAMGEPAGPSFMFWISLVDP